MKTKYDYFSDSSKSKLLNFSEDNDQVISLPSIDNDTRVWYAKLKLEGVAAIENEGSYEETTAEVIDVNEGNFTLNSSLLIDKNWNTYYSAGSATGAIVEVSNLTISNPSHIVIHLKARVYYAGTGRFALYNYNEDYYEIGFWNDYGFFVWRFDNEKNLGGRNYEF